MKLIFAAIAFLAVASALRSESTRRRWSDVDPREVQPFRAGQEYRYQLDTQISTGFASVSDQHSSTRLQSQVLLNFQTERSVVLRMEKIVMGSLNRDVSDPEKVQPVEMFQKVSLEEEELKVLRLPLTFDLVDGIVERIKFHPNDKTWSKNIKRSVLNMLQLNLKEKNELTEMETTPEQYESQTNDKKTKMFVLPEVTLEGECKSSYVLNKSPRSRYSDDNIEMFNVTKSIDFQNCKKIADIRFGPRVEKPCHKCDLNELEERKLDRTTVLRHVLVGNTENYGIHKVEVVSHYLFKMLNVELEKPMHTIVAGELNYMSSESSRRSEGEDPQRMDKEESLLYSTEWDEKEKRFYMYGDEEFPRSSPFESVKNKPVQIERYINKLTHLWSDKFRGIENEATITFTRLVELLRMCTKDELKEAHSKISRGSDRLTETEKERSEELFIDALSNAGTYNTVKYLIEKIKENKISTVRAVTAITGLKGIRMPSEKIVELLLDLSDDAIVERSESLRQTSWLTAGALMGELCDNERTKDDSFEQKLNKPLCTKEKKQEFVKKMLEFFQKSSTRYEKVLALKALGNAGLEDSVFELEKIINDIRRDPVIRMQAIDSLRRLRAVMPRKIQRILMPIFQNVRERPEIRMTAISQMLPTIPEKHVLDQIGYVLLKEPSRQVKSYVYLAMKNLASSPIPTEKEVAERLKSLLRLAGITEEVENEIVRGSRFYRVPFYSSKHREGVSTEFESMVGPDNLLPKHISASIDTLFNGILKKNNLELRVTQENVEKWMEKMWDMEFLNISPMKTELRARRNSLKSRKESSSSEEFGDIRSKLGIQRRSRSQYSSAEVDSSAEIEPYAMFAIRYADIDYIVLPLEEQMLPNSLKRIISSGEKPEIRDFEEIIKHLQGKHFRYQAAYNLFESTTKIPTSMGLPIRMIHVLPVIASASGQMKVKFSGSEINTEVSIHPVLTATHIKRVEVWNPVLLTGSETTQTVEFNLPIDGNLKIKFGSEKSATWTFKIPESRTRLLGFHTLPVSFVAEKDENTGLHKNDKVKRIENIELQDQLRNIDSELGSQLNLPIKVSGDVHMPRELLSYKQALITLLTTENHVHIEMEPSSNSARQIEIKIEGDLFVSSKENTKKYRELKGFYSKAKFDYEVERYYESEDSDEESRLTSFLDDHEPRKMHKHQIRMHVKTVGGRQEKYMKSEIEASCDDRLKHCYADIRAKRSPVFEEERNDWVLNAKVQTLYPEYVDDVRELSSSSKKQQRFVAQVEAEWGVGSKQNIKLNVNGEQFKPKLWLQKMNDMERYNRYDESKLEEQLKLKTAFLNKFDISAEYQLDQSTKSKLSQWMSVLKVWNFWSTRTQQHNGREGSAQATIVFDPITHEHINITVKTPFERVTIDSIPLPTKVKPFELVRKTNTRANSFIEMVNTYSANYKPECVVDGRKVQTFDEVTIKTPLTKCYSVLAKDCSSEIPRFAILMKKTKDEEKKLKMVTGKNTIEVQNENDKLVVKIDGERVTDIDELNNYGIDYDQDMVQIDTRDVSVRFNGNQAWIKLSQFHKNSQCGLCGHYNDDSDDEFRMSDNKHTNDLKQFHKSYSLQDEQCREDFEETHRREKFERIDSDEYERDSREETQKPYEKTHMMELYNHKVCFSQRPVKECPRGTEATEEKDQKMPFLCFSRTSTEGRELIREARRNPRAILELPKEQNPSFIETLRVPIACAAY